MSGFWFRACPLSIQKGGDDELFGNLVALIAFPRVPEVARGCPRLPDHRLPDNCLPDNRSRGCPGSRSMDTQKSTWERRGSTPAEAMPDIARRYPTSIRFDEARADARASFYPTLPDCCPTLQEHVPRKPLANFKNNGISLISTFCDRLTLTNSEKQRGNMESFRKFPKSSGTS